METTLNRIPYIIVRSPPVPLQFRLVFAMQIRQTGAHSYTLKHEPEMPVTHILNRAFIILSSVCEQQYLSS